MIKIRIKESIEDVSVKPEYTLTTDFKKVESELIYLVRVQVKILFFWYSVWYDSCRISDADGRNRIMAGAKRVVFNLNHHE